MVTQDIRQRFDQLLPWYVNGTLDDGGRAWLEQQLADHPELEAELGWTRSLQQRIRENSPEVGEELGFDRLMARIRHERESSLIRPAARPAPPARSFLMGLLDKFQLTPAFAAAAAVVLVQLGVIGALLTQQGELESEFARFRSLNSGQVVTGPALEVSFKSDALEREIRETLVRIGGTLAGGPGQLGIYLVYVPADEIEQARSTLEKSPIVELVTVSRPAGEQGGS